MQYVVIVIAVLVAGYLLFGLIGTAAAYVVHVVDRVGFGVAAVLSPSSDAHSLNIAAWALVGTVVGIAIGLYRGLKSVNRDKMAAPSAVMVGLALCIGLGIAGPSVEEYARGSFRSASSSTQSSSSPPAPQRPPTPPPPPLEPCIAARDPARGEPLTTALKLIEKKTARPSDTDNFVTAAAEAERATSLDPRCAEAHSVLAFARFRVAYRPCSAGSYASAEASARRALELATDNPTRAAAQRNLARVAAAGHQWAESMRLFRASIEAGGANTEAQSWLDDLEMVGSFRPTLISNAARVLKGERLDESNVSDLTAKESSWLLNAALPYLLVELLIDPDVLRLGLHVLRDVVSDLFDGLRCHLATGRGFSGKQGYGHNLLFVSHSSLTPSICCVSSFASSDAGGRCGSFAS